LNETILPFSAAGFTDGPNRHSSTIMYSTMIPPHDADLRLKKRCAESGLVVYGPQCFMDRMTPILTEPDETSSLPPSFFILGG
jgi:hypothetical protein